MTVGMSSEQAATFHRDGFVLLKSFYDIEQEIEPIQRAIHQVIGLVIERHGLEIDQEPFHRDTFDASFMAVVATDRRHGGEIYDAVKHLPAFGRLTNSTRNEGIVSQLRTGAFPGSAVGGSGIRIDIPDEDRFRADWHQDYLGQFRSLDGLVLWSPLVSMTPAIGPVQFCVGSHHDGLRPVRDHDPDRPTSTGVYGLTIMDRDDVVAGYQQAAPLAEVGDLVVIDYQTIHASGHNRSQRARWSMQMRYFNFNDSVGKTIGWRGSFAAGVSIESVHPELIVR